MSIKSIGSIKDYTPNFNFIIPKFDIATWHDYMEKNFRSIDALFYNLFGINNYSGEWTQLTQYKTDQVLFIGEDKKDGEDTEYTGRLVKVLQDHITDNSEYFNLYFEQHPEYYELFADASTAQTFALQAQQSAAKALQSETKAKESEINSKSFEQIAAQKATEALNSANNAQQIINTFENNVNSYTESFNSNAENKLNAYNANDVEKTDAFNQNYTEKLQSFNTNATEKTEIVNNLAQQAQTSATNATNSEQNAASSATSAENNKNLAKQYADEAKSASFGNIGDIIYTSRTDVPNGGTWCDGAEYTKEMFPDIYEMLVDGKIQSTTYQNFTSSVSTNGSCGFFALDSSAQKFKVPLLTNIYIKAGQAPSMFGAESLPNIKGGERVFVGTAVQPPFEIFESATELVYRAGQPYRWGTFNASLVSSTYQDGAKVNPDHVTYRAYVVLYTAAAEASVAQAQEFMTALGGKANIGLDNITAEAKILIAGSGMPSDQYIDVDLQSMGFDYIAPANGYYTLMAGFNANEGAVFYNKTTGFYGSSARSSSVGGSSSAFIPVKKGEIINLLYKGINNLTSFRFYYAEGSKE